MRHLIQIIKKIEALMSAIKTLRIQPENLVIDFFFNTRMNDYQPKQAVFLMLA